MELFVFTLIISVSEPPRHPGLEVLRLVGRELSDLVQDGLLAVPGRDWRLGDCVLLRPPYQLRDYV